MQAGEAGLLAAPCEESRFIHESGHRLPGDHSSLQRREMKPGSPSRLYGKLKQTPTVGFISCLGEAPARAEFLLWG